MELYIRLPAIAKEDFPIDKVGQRFDERIDATIDRKIGSRMFEK